MNNNKLDLLLIDTNSAYTIGIADISVYANNYTVPSTLEIEITPPGYSKITVDFKTKDVNIYRSTDLGIACDETCIELPDGIYEVKYSTPAPKIASIIKYFVKIDGILNEYNQKFLSLDLECDCISEEKQIKQKELFKIYMLINGCVAAANNCNLYDSQAMYQKAQKLLKQFKCK